MGVVLDWNGLWLVCYCIINNDLVIVVLEVGVVEILEKEIFEKGCFGFG